MTYRAIGGRRHRSAAWQWSLIGFLPGLFCGVIVMLAVMLEGTLPQYLLPTAEPQIIERHIIMTATEDPNAPTEQPQFIVVTATPDSAAGQPVTVANPTAISSGSRRHRVGASPADRSADRYACQSHSRNSPDRQRARSSHSHAQSDS